MTSVNILKLLLIMSVIQELVKTRTVQGKTFPNYESVGCYEELTHPVSQLTYIPMTNDICSDVCFYQGYRYAATKDNECWCADNYTVSASSCNITCLGNIGQQCGGNDVYTVVDAELGENIALYQKAYQSSTFNGSAYPGYAVDGDRNSNNSGELICSHTLGEIHPWWSVDLVTSVNVTMVFITNRGDCCSSRLHDFNVGLTDTSPEEIAPSSDPLNYEVCAIYPGAAPSGLTFAIPTRCSKTGRYLIIQLREDDSNYLTLCEVVTIGETDSTTVPPTSLQQSTSTTMPQPITSTAAPTPSSPDITPEPYTTLAMNGTFIATDVISYECSAAYSESFRTSYQSVLSDINSELSGNIMCIFTSGLRVIGPDAFLLPYENTARVQFTTAFYPDNLQVISDVERCTFEIEEYLADTSNWPDPIIPSIDGCPDCYLDPDRFDGSAPKWQSNN